MAECKPEGVKYLNEASKLRTCLARVRKARAESAWGWSADKSALTYEKCLSCEMGMAIMIGEEMETPKIMRICIREDCEMAGAEQDLETGFYVQSNNVYDKTCRKCRMKINQANRKKDKEFRAKGKSLVGTKPNPAPVTKESVDPEPEHEDFYIWHHAGKIDLLSQEELFDHMSKGDLFGGDIIQRVRIMEESIVEVEKKYKLVKK